MTGHDVFLVGAKINETMCCHLTKFFLITVTVFLVSPSGCKTGLRKQQHTLFAQKYHKIS